MAEEDWISEDVVNILSFFYWFGKSNSLRSAFQTDPEGQNRSLLSVMSSETY